MLYRIECHHESGRLITYRSTLEGVNSVLDLEFSEDRSELSADPAIKDECKSCLESYLKVHDGMLSGTTFHYNTWEAVNNITWFGKTTFIRKYGTTDEPFIDRNFMILQLKIEFIDPNTITR